MQPVEEVGHRPAPTCRKILLDRLAREVAEPVVVHLRARGAGDLQRRIEQRVGVERAQRGQQHALGKVAGGSEQQQRVGLGRHSLSCFRC
jgi:hypothetical protein